VTIRAVFFDLFGTLLPLQPLDAACDAVAPGRGVEIASRWRARQIEATWLRTIMDRWVDFDLVTVDALRATLAELDIAADNAAIAELSGAFGRLPLAPDAPGVIDRLRNADVQVGVLTNASERTLQAVVARHPVRFDHVLSVDAVARFKPHPAVYDLAVRATGAAADEIGFVTANGWDAVGASTFGFRVGWLAPAAGAVLPAVQAPAPARVEWGGIPAMFDGKRIQDYTT